MVLRLIVAGMAALAVQATPAGEPRGQPSDALFSRARAALDEKLLDYPSARFRDVHADAARVCGWVNGKNRLGAYTGWKSFGVFGSGETSRLYLDEPEMTELFCTPALMETAPDYSDRLTHR